MRLHHRVSPPPRAIPLLLLSGSLLLRLWLAVSQAQMTTALTPDGTLGTTVTRNGNVYAITGGTRPGNGPNLFHSFDRFSVGTGDTASFRGPQTGITHILSRVTGGQRSDIDGTLRSEIPGAHLYLLNPAGMLFGPNASLDVSGSFHVSTADYLRLADGARFYARLSDTSTLSVAPPAAFGFLGPTPAPLTVQGSALRVPPGETLSMVGGDITIAGDPALTSSGIPTLGAPGGRLHLVSVASAGEVVPQPAGQSPGLEVESFARLGKIEIGQGALIDASSVGGGTVILRGGRLMVDNASLFANTLGNVDGAKLGMDIAVRGDVFVTHGSLITTDTTGAGAAGEIRLSAGSLRMEEGSLLGSIASQEGKAGSIAVQAQQVALTAGAQIASATLGLGQSGAVRVTATDTLSLSGTTSDGASPSGIFADAAGTGAGAGNAGNLVVEAPRVTLTAGAQIASGTFGPGQGGAVRVTATDTLSLSGSGTGPNGVFPSGIFADTAGTGAGAGNAGRIEVQAPRVALTGGAQIFNGTFGPGQGGAVQVTATDTLSLSGSVIGPNGVFPSGILATAEGRSAGAGNAGNLVVEAPRVTLTAGAQIASTTFGPGQGGAVRVTATDTLSLSGSVIGPNGIFTSGIFAEAEGRSAGAGNAGNLVVEAPRVTLTAGAQISSSTLGPGQGGAVWVTATDTLSLSGTTSDGVFPSGILATAAGTGAGAGNAGAVVVEARTVQIADGAEIASSTRGPGHGGTVRVTTAEALTLTGRTSGLATTAAGSGPGGDITVEAHQVQLTEGAAISAESTGVGNAGSITITVRDTFLSQHSTVTTAASQADGGNIHLSAPRLIRLRDSQITAAVGGGPATVGGNITIDPQFVVLQNGQIVANAFEGQGGNIRIVAGVLLADPASRIDASSQRGINGQVNIQAPVTSISGTVAPLPQAFAPAAELLRTRCAARLHEGTVSSLVERGRDGVPASPEGLLPSRLAGPPPGAATPGAAGQRRRKAPVAHQGGLQRDATGQLQITHWPTVAATAPGQEVECAAR